MTLKFCCICDREYEKKFYRQLKSHELLRQAGVKDHLKIVKKIKNAKKIRVARQRHILNKS